MSNNSDCNCLVFESLSLESSRFITWESRTNYSLLVLVLTTGSAALVIYALFLRFIYKHADPNRPINELIAMDQIARFCMVATTMVCLVAVLASGKPIKAIFGEAGCAIYGTSRHLGAIHSLVARKLSKY